MCVHVRWRGKSVGVGVRAQWLGKSVGVCLWVREIERKREG